MEDGGEDMELKYELWKESIVQEKVISECRKRLSGYRRAVLCNRKFLGIPYYKKRHNVKEITVLYIISIHKGIYLCVMSTGLQHLLIRINIRYF